MTAETLSALAGLALSLAAAYCPGFAPWFAALDGMRKRGVLLALLTAAATGSYLLACLSEEAACGWPQALAAARVWLAALIANQATFQIAVRHTPTWRVFAARADADEEVAQA